MHGRGMSTAGEERCTHALLLTTHSPTHHPILLSTLAPPTQVKVLALRLTSPSLSTPIVLDLSRPEKVAALKKHSEVVIKEVGGVID